MTKLKNGKFVAVEYQGGHFEKERLGKLWEARSEGQCFFEMFKGPGELGKIQDAIKRAIAGGCKDSGPGPPLLVGRLQTSSCSSSERLLAPPPTGRRAQ